ncbi:hypothetical protein NUSPORA_01887 [Nucleospora cyclopteri]
MLNPFKNSDSIVSCTETHTLTAKLNKKSPETVTKALKKLIEAQSEIEEELVSILIKNIYSIKEAKTSLVEEYSKKLIKILFKKFPLETYSSMRNAGIEAEEILSDFLYEDFCKNKNSNFLIKLALKDLNNKTTIIATKYSDLTVLEMIKNDIKFDKIEIKTKGAVNELIVIHKILKGLKKDSFNEQIIKKTLMDFLLNINYDELTESNELQAVINAKYHILIDIYATVDENVYKYSKFLSINTLRKLKTAVENKELKFYGTHKDFDRNKIMVVSYKAAKTLFDEIPLKYLTDNFVSSMNIYEIINDENLNKNISEICEKKTEEVKKSFGNNFDAAIKNENLIKKISEKYLEIRKFFNGLPLLFFTYHYNIQNNVKIIIDDSEIDNLITDQNIIEKYQTAIFNCGSVNFCRRILKEYKNLNITEYFKREKEIDRKLTEKHKLNYLELGSENDQFADLFELTGCDNFTVNYEHSFLFLLHLFITLKPLEGNIDYFIAFKYFYNSYFIEFLVKNYKINESFTEASLIEIEKINITNYNGYNLDEEILNDDSERNRVDLSVIYEITRKYRIVSHLTVLELILQFLFTEKIVVEEKSNKEFYKLVEDLRNFIDENRYKKCKKLALRILNEITETFPNIELVFKSAVSLDKCIRYGFIPVYQINLNEIEISTLSDEAIKLIFDKNKAVKENEFTNRLKYTNGTIKENCFTGDTEIKNTLIAYNNTDLLLLAENDSYLSYRIDIYNTLISITADEISYTMIDSYSLSKTEENAEDEFVFDYVIDLLYKYEKLFFILLIKVMEKIRNISLINFIAEMIGKRLENGEERIKKRFELFIEIITCTVKNNSILKYTFLPDNSLFWDSFSINFPVIYRKLNSQLKENSKLNYTAKPLNESFSRNICSKLLCENVKLSVIDSTDHFVFRYYYEVDSVIQNFFVKVYKNVMKEPVIISDQKQTLISDKNTSLNRIISSLLKKSYKIYEIFLIWKVELDNRLAKFTECLICYFIIDPEKKTYPEFTCNNCKVRFHSSCIYKWKGNSNTDKCPMCRKSMFE